MRFAQHFVGAQSVTATLNGAGPLIDAFVFERSGKLQLALINKSDNACTCALPSGLRASPRLLLSGPAIDTKEGVKLSPLHSSHYRDLAIAGPYSAIAFELKGTATSP
jgi:hypothetical protein